MSDIVDPSTREPIFSGVHISDQLYFGRMKERAPDLILDTYDSDWNVKMSYPGLVDAQPEHPYFVEGSGDSGWHSRDGIYVFTGSAFQSSEKRVESSVLDIPATLLHIYGVPIPDDFDGSVMAHTMSSKALQLWPVSFQSGDAEMTVLSDEAYSARESEDVLDHLRALGYVD